MSDPVSPARFPTTCWSRIALAADPNGSGARRALTALCLAYWFPVYAFIRRKGHPAEQTHDLTQEFFTLLLETESFAAVEPARGRFRSFLLAACTHFLSNVRDHDRALKRGGGRRPISIDARAAETRFGNEPAHDQTPERIFEQRWALALLEQVHDSLYRTYQQAGKAALFEALWGSLDGRRSPDRESYAVVGERLGMTERAVQMAARRLRRRYGEALRARIAETVSDDSQIDDEIRDLFVALQK